MTSVRLKMILSKKLKMRNITHRCGILDYTWKNTKYALQEQPRCLTFSAPSIFCGGCRELFSF